MTSSLRVCLRRKVSRGRHSELPLPREPLFAFLAIVFLFCAMAGTCTAQDQGPELRTVHGTVIDTSENPVGSAIVYLKNMKTQDVKTYITRQDGLYRFSGLDPNVDYEVHAEHDEMVSSTREVSSYDSRRDIDFQLKLAHKKPPH